MLVHMNAVKKPKAQLDSQAIKSFLRQNRHGEAWLADQVNVHYNSVRNWLEKGTVPETDHLLKIAELMNVTPQSLLK